MKIDKIIVEINKRIEELETKKGELNVKEMSISKRNQLEDEYNNELDKLYRMRRGF